MNALRGERTLAEHGGHPTWIGQWKRQAAENMATVFGGGAMSGAKEKEARVEKLHAKIGQLVVERNF